VRRSAARFKGNDFLFPRAYLKLRCFAAMRWGLNAGDQFWSIASQQNDFCSGRLPIQVGLLWADEISFEGQKKIASVRRAAKRRFHNVGIVACIQKASGSWAALQTQEENSVRNKQRFYP